MAEPVITEVAAAPGKVLDLSPELMEQAAKLTERLFKSDEILQMLAGSFLITRQIYYILLTALDRHVADLGEENTGVPGEVWEGLKSIIVEAQAEAAKQQMVSRKEVFQRLHAVLIPVLKADMAETEMRVRREESKTKQVEEVARRDTGVSVMFSAEYGKHTITRERSVVLQGGDDNYPANIERLLYQAATTYRAGDKPVVVHLVSAPIVPLVSKRDNKDRRYVTIGSKQWTGAGNTTAGLERFLSSWLRTTYKNQIDLLICDDLTQLSDSKAGPPMLGATNVHRHLRKVADKLGFAVLAALPLNNGGGPTFSLEVYADLLTVRTSDDSEHTWPDLANAAGVSWSSAPPTDKE